MLTEFMNDKIFDWSCYQLQTLMSKITLWNSKWRTNRPVTHQPVTECCIPSLHLATENCWEYYRLDQWRCRSLSWQSSRSVQNDQVSLQARQEWCIEIPTIYQLNKWDVYLPDSTRSTQQLNRQSPYKIVYQSYRSHLQCSICRAK